MEKLFKNMSPNLKTMFIERRGYRYEGYGGGGSVDWKEVIYFEMVELMNSDIPDSCNKIYQAGFDLGNSYVREELVRDGIPEDSEEYEEMMNAGLLNYYSENASSFYEEVLSFIEKNVPFVPQFAFWMATKEGVKLRYLDKEASEEEIQAYRIPEHAFVISDLYTDGALFLLDEHPDWLWIENLS